MQFTAMISHADTTILRMAKSFPILLPCNVKPVAAVKATSTLMKAA